MEPTHIRLVISESFEPLGGHFLMLKVFLDRGAKRDSTDEIIAVAATVFTPLRYKQFVRPWNRMLKGWGASAFHATDFYNGAGEFKRDSQRKRERFEKDSRIIPTLIGQPAENILIVAARPEELLGAAPLGWKEQFGRSVHSIGVQMCLISMGWWAEKNHFNERFAYFRESGDEDDAEVASTVERMRYADAATARMIRVASFSHVQKGVTRGTEASDFVAWHWNKYYMDKIRKGDAENPRKDFAALAAASEKKIRYIFLTGGYLSLFFSSKWRKVFDRTRQTSGPS